MPPVYFERPYYLGPTKAGRKAYALLREVMKRSEKIGIAKVVIRTRQHLAAVVPFGDALTLVLLRFEDELRDAKGLDLPGTSMKSLGITPKELDMAERLLNGMGGQWDPTKYRDDYREDILALIEAKVEAGEVDTVPEPESKRRRTAGRRSAKVIDLMTLLKESVSTQRPQTKGKPRKTTARTRATPRRKSA